MSGGLTLPLLLAGGAGAAGLLLLAIARPALACAVLAVAIPVTAGLGRGTVVPVLRVNEALLLVVTAGVALGRLPRRKQLPFTGLDLAVLAFCAAGVLIPWAVILLSGAIADQQDWVQVLSPVQYLLVYLLFSRTAFPGPALRRLLNGLMLASIPVAVVALAQLVDLGGARDLVGAYYPTQPLPSWDTVYRPASLLGYYGAVGAFGLLNFLLALALSATRHPGFSRPWLAVVMGVNLVGVLASATLAPLLALPVGAVAVLLVARRVPWDQAALSLPLLAAAVVALWPQLAARAQQQLGAGAGLHLPETLATRLTYWQGFFVPALLAHGPWLGTGTLIPSEVPRPLVDFVDNGYLWQWYRAGVPGIALYLLLLAAVGAAGWACRSHPDPSRRAVGAVCLGTVASLVLVDVTSEYLTFTAVSQEFWMLAGVLTGLTLAARAAPVPFVEVGVQAGRLRRIAAAARPGWAGWRRAAAALRRLAPEGAFVRSSLAVLAGFGVARLLGFGFQVAAGRLLAPADYGRLTYALAVAAVLSVLLTTAPLGLSRFLARHADDRQEQAAWYGGWLAAVGLVLGASAAVTAVAAPLLGLGGWLLAGLLANLLGVAALETYRELQRGLGRYALQSAFYVVANALQLAAVLALSAAGHATPAPFLLAYGLSSVGALLLFAPLSRGVPPLRLRTVRWTRVWEVLRFLRPVLLDAVLWNVWFFGDLILVQYLRGGADTGTYGAAKAMANGFLIVPAAISFVLAPRVARLTDGEVRGALARAVLLTAAAVLPLAAVMAAAARPLTFALFGGRYAAAAGPLAVLAVGTALYGLKSVLGALWLGLGRPVVDTVATGAATAVSLAAGLLLIPRSGPLGAAVAFSAGAAAQLAVAGAVTVSSFTRPRRRALPGSAPVLLVAEELDRVPDEAYTKFVLEAGAALAGRRPVVRRSTRAGRWSRLPPARAARRAVQLACARAPGGRPAAVVYACRSSVTVMALLRARLLRLLRGAPVALVALRESRVRSRRLLRLLAPDLLLVPTAADCAAARRAGVNAARVWSGVDLDRFRPALPDERAALRRRWSLPESATVVLHVGHLGDGPTLERPLASLAAAGATVLVVASDRRGPESHGPLRALRAAGVRVLEGYQPRIEELYRLADCYLFAAESPGHAAALPLTVLEALACDVPVACLRFGALAERFEGAAGVSVVDRPEELGSAALALAGSGARTRPLAEPFGWTAVTERLLALLDDALLARAPAPPGARLATLRGRCRRAAIELRGWPRRWLWGGRVAYEARTPAGVAVEPAAVVRLRRPAAPASDAVGLLDAGPGGVVAAAARLGGLRAMTADLAGSGRLIDRAVTERWPLLHARFEDLDRLSGAHWRALAAFVQAGGTLYVDGAAVDRRLQALAGHLQVTAPAVRQPAGARTVTFAAEPADFAGELAGARLAAPTAWPALLPAAGWEVLVRAGGRAPVVLRHRVGRGAVILGVGPAGVPHRLADALVAGSPLAAAAAIPLVLLRSLYGTSAWHPPAVLANFSIDDPALRRGRLGLRWDLLLAQSRDHGFHATIATMPRELALAEAPVVELLRRHPGSLSVCYHGSDHDGYEFYAPDARRTRYPPRPLTAQRQALRRAVERGLSFTAALGAELDRVMVFPHGPGPAAILPDLHRLGFVASANFADKDPPGGTRPEDEDLGLRPADLAWSGFPLLWRRGLGDRSVPVDLLLGRPALAFAHPRDLGEDFAPFVERAAAIDRLTGGRARWCSLDEVARHAYLQRRLAGGGWQVLMTGNEACLHNPDPEPRAYAVLRPHRPPDTVFEVAGMRAAAEPLVTVPAGGTSVVRLVTGGGPPPLAGRRRCSIFP